jgi:GntR family transcriptional regulator
MMTMSSVAAIRNLILDRLAEGKYPVGNKLPTSRELAAELGVNRNTVIKAYRSLADLGLVSVQQGKGTFVVAIPNLSTRPGLSEQVEGDIASVVQRAWQIGVHEDELRRMVTDNVDNVYGPGRRRGAFVECNESDLDAAIAQIAALTGVRLTPILLEDLVARPLVAVRGYDAVFTSLFHIREVSDTLSPLATDLDIVAIHTHPDEIALSEIAQIGHLIIGWWG